MMTAPECNTCPNCRSVALEPFHEVDGVPVNSCILVDSPEAAGNFPLGDVRLGFCPECGFVSNLSFDPALAGDTASAVANLDAMGRMGWSCGREMVQEHWAFEAIRDQTAFSQAVARLG